MSDDDLNELESMYQIGRINGEDVRKIDVSEIQRMEPNLKTDDVKAGLYSPNEYTIDPFLLPLSNLYSALHYGCKLFTNCKVVQAQFVSDDDSTHWKVSAEMKCNEFQKKEKRQFSSKVVINCAGNYSDEADKLFCRAKDTFDITPAKGEYIAYTSLYSAEDRVANGMVNCIPTKSFAGPYTFRSVYGNFVVGPTKITQESKTDRTCKNESIKFLENYAKERFPCLKDEPQCLFETYAGLRPQNLKNADYDIRFDTKNMWATLGAIRSTGLSASRAIAQYAAQKLYDDYNHITKLKDVVMPPPAATKDGKWKVGKYVFLPTHKLSELGLQKMLNRKDTFASSL